MKIQSRMLLFPAMVVSVSLFALLISCSQPKQKSFVIGIVNPNKGSVEMTQGFIDGLAEYGYIEGKNVSHGYQVLSPAPV